MELLGMKDCPIFCCDEALEDCNDLGNASRECIIHLKVPIAECEMMEYYDWTDVMFSLQEKDDFLIPCTNQLKKEFSNKMDPWSYEKLQVVLTKIKRDWIQNIEYK